MGSRMTREEFLERVFSRKYEELKGKDLRLVRVKVIGREISWRSSSACPRRGSIRTWASHRDPPGRGPHRGIHRPAAHHAVGGHGGGGGHRHEERRCGAGLLDRFSGAVILLGSRAEVRSAMEHVLAFFRHELHFTVCEITES